MNANRARSPAAIACALAVLVSGMSVPARAEPDEPQPDARGSEAEPAGARPAATLPSGTRVAFESNRTGNFEILVMNGDGSGQTPLTNDPGDDEHASWAPDGSRIAFHSNRDGDYDVYSMRPDGSDVRQLTNQPAYDAEPSWSPDGRSIAFSSDRGGNLDVWVMDADGTNARRVTDSTAADGSPDWLSNDALVFNSLRDGNLEIYRGGVDGSAVTRLTSDPAVDGGPRAFADGSRIVFHSNRAGNFDVLLLNLATGSLTAVANSPTDDATPDACGPLVLFQARRDGNGEVYVSEADGSSPMNLTNSAAGDDHGATCDEPTPPPTIADNGLIEIARPEPERNPPCVCPENVHTGGIPEAGGACDNCGAATGLLNLAQTAGAYSVFLHSGEFFLRETDLRIPGRGFGWSFERTYRSGAIFDGPLGHGWDFKYNRRIVVARRGNLAAIRAAFPAVQVGDVVRMDGLGRADVYPRGADGSLQAPAGFYEALATLPDGGFVERDAGGTRVRYGRPDTRTGVAPMFWMQDRNGNVMRFRHDSAGRLVEVTDTLGRKIAYVYGSDGRLDEVRDFTGRSIRFEHDARGDLVSVTSPAVTGTPNGNDFPLGRTTRYTYSTGFNESRLNHNMLTISAPNEVASGGPPRVVVTYETDARSADADRVLSQTVGGTNATGVPSGGTIRYSYRALASSTGPNVAVSETTVLDRNGNRAEYAFNSVGNILAERRFSNRDVVPSDAAVYETRLEYNRDGELTRATFPEGNPIEYRYESSRLRYGRGNLVAEIRRADSDRGGDQETITTTYRYEPIFNQRVAVTEPRGNDPSYRPQNGGRWSSARYRTIQTLDYQEGDPLSRFSSQLRIPQAQVRDLLERANVRTGLGDVNGDGTTTQTGGNVVRLQRPSVRLLPACASASPPVTAPACSHQARLEGTSTQPIRELFRYNRHGQAIRHVDPEGNVVVASYYPASDPEGDGTPTPGVGDEPNAGYMRAFVRDAINAAIRDSRTNPPRTQIRTLFFYDAFGNVRRQVDGRGVATDYAYNALNELVQATRAAEVNAFSPSPPEPVPLTAFRYLTRFFLDHNGNVALKQVEDRGNTSRDGGDNVGTGSAFVDTVYRYDILDNLVETSEEVSDDEDLVTRIRRDPHENEVWRILPVGNAVSFEFDERDLIRRTTHGAVAPPPLALLGPDDPRSYDVRGGNPATMTYHYDGNNNLIEEVDAEDDGSAANNSDLGGAGDRTRFIFDGFDRQTSEVDPVGNQSVRQLDPASNVVRVARFGPTGGPSPTSDGPDVLARPVSSRGVVQAGNLVTSSLLEATTTRYDELGRGFQTERALFVNTTPTAREPDVADGAADVGKGDLTPGDTCAVSGVPAPPSGWLGCVSERRELDRNSRETFRWEDDKDVPRTLYDGMDREIESVDPAGNRVRTAYDDNGNVIETSEVDRASPRGVRSEVFLTTYFHDSLNRLFRTIDNLGDTTEQRHDSRDNIVAYADAQGPPGPDVPRRVNAPGPRTVNRTNLFGNVTRYSVDGLGRPTLEEHVLTASGAGDGTTIGADEFGMKTPIPSADPSQAGDGLVSIRSVWDANSLLETRTDDNGNVTRLVRDNLDRLTRRIYGACSPPPTLASRCDPPTSETVDLDRDGNPRRRVDQNGTVIDCSFDAVDRATACTIARAAGVVGSTRLEIEWNGASLPTLVRENNDPADPDDDATVTVGWDSLFRALEEAQSVGSGPTRAVGSSWRADDLRVAVGYPNGRTVRRTFDAVDRPRRISDEGATTSIAEYDYIGPNVLERRHPQNGTRLTYLDDARGSAAGYDGLRREVLTRHVRSDGTSVVGFGRQYNRASSPLGETKLHDTANSEQYGLDSLYRVISLDRRDGASVTPVHGRRTLDGAGNWRTDDAEQRAHTSFNEIAARGATALSHDENGNLTDDGTFRYQWDWANRLRRVLRSSDGSVVASYLYDPFGRRLVAIVGDGPSARKTLYTLDGAQEIEERGGSGELLRQFVFGRDVDEALVMDTNRGGSTATGPEDERHWYHQNAMMSVHALTDRAGHVVEGYLYEVFGGHVVFRPGPDGRVGFGVDDEVVRNGDSSVGNPFLFTGRRRDAETGLYYFRARYLDPDAGRFISRDPLGMWADDANLGNTYAYAGNRPVMLTDPFGLQGQCGSFTRTATSKVFYACAGCLPILGTEPHFWAGPVGAAIAQGGALELANLSARAQALPCPAQCPISSAQNDPKPVCVSSFVYDNLCKVECTATAIFECLEKPEPPQPVPGPLPVPIPGPLPAPGGRPVVPPVPGTRPALHPAVVLFGILLDRVMEAYDERHRPWERRGSGVPDA